MARSHFCRPQVREWDGEIEMSDPREEVQAEGGRDVYGFQSERWRSVREEHREGVLCVHQQLVDFYPILEAILQKKIRILIRHAHKEVNNKL